MIEDAVSGDRSRKDRPATVSTGATANNRELFRVPYRRGHDQDLTNADCRGRD